MLTFKTEMDQIQMQQVRFTMNQYLLSRRVSCYSVKSIWVYFSDRTDFVKKDPSSILLMTKLFFKKFCQSGFCENTTLHGYNYLCFADSTIYKCIWFILILVMNGVAIYFFVKNTDAYINGGLQYEIETSTASLKVRPYCIGIYKVFK